MKNEVKYEEGCRIKFRIGNIIKTGIIKQIHESGFEVEEDDTEKKFFVDYRKILEKLDNK
jgi:hypothetical protein